MGLLLIQNYFRMKQREKSPDLYSWGKRPLMKSSVLMCLLAAMLLLSTQLYAQPKKNVTITFKNEQLASALKKIGNVSGSKIVFNTEDVRGFTTTCTIQSATVEKALELVIGDKPFIYKNDGEFISVVKKRVTTGGTPTIASTQARAITGTVIDSDKLELPGVNVAIKGTAKGAITATDGSFSVLVPVGHTVTLVFSYVGMESLEKVITMGNENIGLGKVILNEDHSQLAEVVVTGVFNKPRESYTGAATSFTKKQLQESGSRSMISALKNLDPSFNIADNVLIGSDPNSLPSITIRGASSLPTDVKDLQVSSENQRTANQPLFIMDGFEITLTRFMDLDESQIENITLLKDANATALYGSKGSNGVVVITSKVIPAGKLRISYKGTLSIEAPDLTSYNLMNASEKLTYEKAAGLYKSDNAIIEQELLDLYNQRKTDAVRGVDTYWLKYPVRTGGGSRHSLSIDGGNESLRYGASIGYNDVEGAMKGSSRKVFTGNMFLLYKHKNWTFQNDLQITSSKSTNSPYGSFSQYCNLNSYYMPFGEDGKPQKVLEDYVYTSMGSRKNLVYNPLYNAYLPSRNTSEYTDITNNFAVEWHILPELFVRGQFSYTKQTTRSDVYVSAEHTMFADFVGADYSRKGRYTMGNGSFNKYTGQLTLNYSKEFNNIHQVFGGIGVTLDESKSESYSVVGEGISVLNMDFLGMASQYYKDGRPFGVESISRDAGFLFNFRYTYDRRYFFDLNGKYDGSSQFGSENQFAPFWSTGAGWNIQNEEFLLEHKWINIARLRASYGVTGSQNFASYLGFRSYQDYGGKSTQGWYGVYLMAFGNPDLQWQKTTQLNLGLDLELLNRRLDITFDWYNKTTDDLLSDVNLPLSSGFKNYKSNVGKIQNQGVELYINGTIIQNVEHDFRWRMGVKMIHNRNTIKSISNSLQTMNDDLLSTAKGTNYNPSFLYKEGESINTIYAVRSKGIDPGSGKEIYIKQDGTETFTWDAKDQVACGVASPKLEGTVNAYVYWKGLSLNAIFGYRWGGYAYNATLANKVENIFPYNNADKRVLYDRWKQPGDVVAYKSVTDFSKTYATSRFIFKDNAFYGSSLNLGYELPSEWTRKHLHLEYLSLSGNVEDLFYWSTMKRERGTDYPFSRKVSFSVTARF